MQGSPKSILVIKREMAGDMMPDFSGEGFLAAKKKLVHGCDMCGGGHSKSSPCEMKADSEEEDHGHDEEPMKSGAMDMGDDDESYESKVAKMRSMAQDMLKISDELAKASEMYAGQSEKLRKLSEDHDAAYEE